MNEVVNRVSRRVCPIIHGPFFHCAYLEKSRVMPFFNLRTNTYTFDPSYVYPELLIDYLITHTRI